ncbi:MAG: carbohydrate kinase family protein [Acholeplasmataceae bacterium]
MLKDGITIAGNIIVDTNKFISHYPKEGYLTHINKSYDTLGGSVPNVSVSLRAIDKNLNILAMGTIGKDSKGKLALDYFKENNINYENVEISLNHQTSYVDALMNEYNKKRTFLFYEGANGIFGKNLKEVTTKHFHLGYLLLLPYLDKLKNNETKASLWLKKLKEQGITTSCDLVTEDSNRYIEVIKPSLPYIDYLIINELEASKLSKIDIYDNEELNLNKLIKCAEVIKDMGVIKEVIIHSPKISIIYNGSETIKLKSLNINSKDIINSVGAGDAFCAGILYGIINKKSSIEKLRIASSLAVSCLFSNTPKPIHNSLEEILLLEKKYGRLN